MKKIFCFLVFGFQLFSSIAQVPGQFVVSFSDKLNSPFTLESPEEFLSARSLYRRESQGIELNETDLPISPLYLKEVSSGKSVKVLSTSKWFNDVVVEVNDSSALEKILSLEYVKDIDRLPGSNVKTGSAMNKSLDVEVVEGSKTDFLSEYGYGLRQISMLNADYLHLQGYLGENMRITVIDAGFTYVWSSKHFEHLYQENRIIDFYDFVDNDDSIYDHSLHGNYVLSTMASYSPDSFIGTAPMAEYILLRTEDGKAEYILEEYYWTEAAEFADSAGSDLINSSLGYTTFDDSLQNHTHDDLDGKTTRITLSADIAADKGMLVFNSAGNSGNNSWEKISAPADANKIVTIGSVDSSGTLSSFSSRGPTADNRIKPDIMAMGEDVYIGVIDGSVGKSSGTSFASPVMAGAAACLWQSNRNKKWSEIKSALIQSADRYENPDTNYGFGIPDFIVADDILKGRRNSSTGNESIRYFPNPTNSELFVILSVPQRESMVIEIYNQNGQVVDKMERIIESENTSYLYLNDEISGLAAGLYIFSFSSQSINERIKVVIL